MKKIFGIALLFCAFSQSNFAQKTTAKLATKEVTKATATETLDVVAEAKKNTALLTETVTLTPQDQENFQRLFEYKYRLLNENLSEERKAELANIIEMKIRASLSSNQMAKLDAKPEVLKKLKY